MKEEMYRNIRKKALYPDLVERRCPLHGQYYIAQRAENQDIIKTKRSGRIGILLCNIEKAKLHFC